MLNIVLQDEYSLMLYVCVLTLSQVPEDQCISFSSIDLLKDRAAHLLVFIQHVMLQFDPAPLVRIGEHCCQDSSTCTYSIRPPQIQSYKYTLQCTFVFHFFLSVALFKKNHRYLNPNEDDKSDKQKERTINTSFCLKVVTYCSTHVSGEIQKEILPAPAIINDIPINVGIVTFNKKY